MHRPLCLLASITLLSSTAFAEEQWTPLLNGNDLGDWVNVNCAPETWSVKDGLVRCTGKPTGALRSPRMYENFVMELDWRHLESGGNAGVFIWASPIAAKGVPFLRAIEVQVLDEGYGNTDSYTTHGDVFPIHGATMVPFPPSRGMRSFPKERRSNPSPEWNHYRIEANNGVLRLSVNGKEVSGGEKCNWRKGYIGLESEGAPTEWKNIRITELPSTNAPTEETAPESKGYRPLYNGVDLRGWKTPSPESWKVDDSELKAVGGDLGSRIWCDTPLGDAEILFDFGAQPKSDFSILLGDASDLIYSRISLAELIPDGTAQWPAKWHRIRLTLKGNKVTVSFDEKQIREQNLKDGPKRFFGIDVTKGAPTFTNFYLRNLQQPSNVSAPK